MKTRAYLILMTAAIVAPVVAISSVGLDMLLKRERESRLHSIQETARATSLLIDRELASAESALQLVAHSKLIQNDDYKRLHELMSEANTTPDYWTLLSDYTGRPLMNTLVPFGTPLPNYGGKWATDTVDSKKTRVSGYFIGVVAKRPTISVDVPTPPSSGKKYVVSRIYDARYFNRIFDPGTLPPSWLVGIVDANGLNIGRNKSAEKFTGKMVRKELFEAMQAHQSGWIRHMTREGLEVYDVFAKSSFSGWTVAIGVPVAEIESAARKATWIAAASLAAILCIAAGISVLIARKLSSALQQATLAARALGRGFTEKPRKSNVDEVDTFISVLHDTSAALAQEKASRQALERERESLLKSEQEARKQAQAQNKAKDEFLAMLGHELRNPLAAISGAMTVIDTADASGEALTRAKRIGKRQVEHLAKIVDDLLDVQRILSRKIVLNKEPLNAADVLRHCYESMKTADAGKHAWELAAQEAWIEADKTRLEQVIGNLLGNAARYTPQGGAIAASCRLDGNEVAIEVSDTGVGIDPALHSAIFEVFVQGPTSIDRAQGGLGIGLAVARELTALHHGTINVKSEGAGKGSTFVLRFPITEKPAALNDSISVLTDHPPVHVLVVEDNQDGREMLATMLELHGFRVSTAGNGADALSLARALLPDVALVDIGLPDISGYEVARRLFADAATRQVRLVALTGYGLEADKEAATKAGFSAHITKPYLMESLIRVLSKEDFRSLDPVA